MHIYFSTYYNVYYVYNIGTYTIMSQTFLMSKSIINVSKFMLNLCRKTKQNKLYLLNFKCNFYSIDNIYLYE